MNLPPRVDLRLSIDPRSLNERGRTTHCVREPRATRRFDSSLWGDPPPPPCFFVVVFLIEDVIRADVWPCLFNLPLREIYIRDQFNVPLVE